MNALVAYNLITPPVVKNYNGKHYGSAYLCDGADLYRVNIPVDRVTGKIDEELFDPVASSANGVAILSLSSYFKDGQPRFNCTLKKAFVGMTLEEVVANGCASEYLC